MNVFEKRYSSRNGFGSPVRVVGNERDVRGEPFLGDPAARLQVLLPDEPTFDLAVNIFRFEPGATLPFVEVHVMEHGLLMLAGQGIYRLSDRWYPVQKGDAIWMAPFCPQWFAATGKQPAAYLYYKDVNRDPSEVVP
jgi:(S)-ureidoglycine aminohydrolase